MFFILFYLILFSISEEYKKAVLDVPMSQFASKPGNAVQL